jgi:hypothetical protein
MSKTNAAKRPSSDRTLPHPLDDAAPSSEQQPKLSVYRDVEDDKLVEMRDSIVAEIKRRADERKAKRPQKGAIVEIIGGSKKHVGKQGTVSVANSSRCVVDCEGTALYLRFGDIRVTG